VSLATVRVNGQPAEAECAPSSYLALNRRWTAGDCVELDLPLDVTTVESHPRVEETRNHVAVMRGPVVYCLESPDLPDGVDIHDVRLPREAAWTARHERELLRGVTVLETAAAVVSAAGPADALYRRRVGSPEQSVPLKLIPYYAWSNRGPSQMTVWLPLY
jgi:hypothetical protein